jgi:hypothetical protein
VHGKSGKKRKFKNPFNENFSSQTHPFNSKELLQQDATGQPQSYFLLTAILEIENDDSKKKIKNTKMFVFQVFFF